MQDIETMTTTQWLAYRADRLADYYARGFDLVPQPGCSTCDQVNDYVCLDCELIQIDQAQQ